MNELRTVRVFVSSPGDVAAERVVVERVLQRLQGEFQAWLRIEPVFWEHEPVRATADYQSQFPHPSSCDVVVCILWSRLGTRLPDEFGTKPDGSPWRSGTEFELTAAAQSYRERKLPDLLVFRKTADWRPPGGKMPDDPQEFQRLWEQRQALNQFLDHWFGGPEAGFKAGFTTFVDEEEFESKILVHLRKLLREKLPLGEGSGEAPSAWWTEGSPFRGLAPFEAKHAPIFFGRTRAIFAVRNLLVQRAAAGSAFLAILGASGSGKSSLLRAGVAPTLTHPGVVPDVDVWRTAVMRPGGASHPCEALAAALEDANALPELSKRGYTRPELLLTLRTSPQTLHQPIRAALSEAADREYASEKSRWRRKPALRLLLVVDQFEEIFTHANYGDEARGEFVRCLAAMARSGVVWVAAAVRSDYYHRCVEIPEFAELKGEDGQYDLLPPTPDELRQMIAEPALAAGLRFERSADAERLDAVLQDAAARNPGALPLLEFALEELYKCAEKQGTRVLALRDYSQIGGIEGAVARRAEEELSKLSDEVQQAFGDVMSMAVHVSPQGVAAAPIPLQRLSENARKLVDALVAARLMATDARPDGTPIVRLVHDALLTHWERLKHWIADNGELLRTRGRLEAACRHWLESGRDRAYLLAEGKPLVDGRDLTQKMEGRLDPDLVEFVRASEALAASRRRARRLAVAAVAALFVAVTSGAAAWIARERASGELAGRLLQDHGETSTRIVRQIQPAAGVDPQVAIANITALADLFDQLAKLKGDSPDLSGKKGELSSAMADVYLDLADVAKAEELARSADAAFAKALEGDVDARRWRTARARNMAVFVRALSAQHRFVEAGRVADQASTQAESLRKAHPGDLECLNLWCNARRQKGGCLYYIGDAYQARAYYREALKELGDASESLREKEAADLSESERETLKLLARTLLGLADASDDWEPPAKLESWRREALSIAEKLAAASPGDSNFALLLADARMDLQPRIAGERPDEGRRLVELAHQSAAAHSELNQAHSDWSRLRIYSSYVLGDLVLRAGASPDEERTRLREGVERFKRDLAFADDICKKYPQNRFWWNLARGSRSQLSVYCLQLAWYEADPKVKSELLKEGRRLRELAEQSLRERLREDLDNWVLLTSLKASTQPDRFDLWIDYHRRRLAEAPDNPSWTAGVAEGLACRGFDLPKRDDSDLVEAVRLYDALSERNPAEWQWASRAAEATYRRYRLASTTKDTMLEGELLRDGIARYERLAARVPEWARHHERLFEFRMQLVGDARERENWAEAADAMKSALDALDSFYSAFPSEKPRNLLNPSGSFLASVRAFGELAAPTRLDLVRERLYLGHFLTRIQIAMPREWQVYRRVDAVRSIVEVVAKIASPNNPDARRRLDEARGTLQLARCYLDELREMDYAHPALDVWREAVEATLAELPQESHPVPVELRRAYDAMDFRGAVEGWIELGAAPRDLLAWLDSEARLARDAVWRQPALWTLLFLSDEAAEALLDVETLDAAAFGPARFSLAPETLALLQGIAAWRGDAWTYRSLFEHGPPSGDAAGRLDEWAATAGEIFSNSGGEHGVFTSRNNLADAAGLASVDENRVADALPRMEQCRLILSLAGKSANFGLTEEDRKSLEGIRNDEAAPSRTRDVAAVVVAESLLWKGDYGGAREILMPLAAEHPDRLLILQDLVLLELMARASADSKHAEFDPLGDLRVRLLEARYPEHPIGRLLVAWWSAQYRGAQDAFEKVVAIAQQPGYGDSWFVHDALGRVAEASGKPADAKARFERALELIPDNDESRPYRERLIDRLTSLERQE